MNHRFDHTGLLHGQQRDWDDPPWPYRKLAILIPVDTAIAANTGRVVHPPL